MTKYFDQSGNYKAYTNDDKNLFNESGEHIGHFLNGFLYDIKGQAIGHIRDKKILDKKGQTLYYKTWLDFFQFADLLTASYRWAEDTDSKLYPHKKEHN